MGVSKNSKKGSKVQQAPIIQKKVREKKPFIMVEITKEVYEQIKTEQNLSSYKHLGQEYEVVETINKFGKKYLRLKR
jgi:hypothetical protein